MRGDRLSKGQMRREYQRDQFEDRERTTIMMVTLKTFGTAAQAEQTVEKMKTELALQGIRVEISDVHPD